MTKHIERAGSGVMYWEPQETRKSPKAPDFKGFIVLECDYKAGEKLRVAAWQHPTSQGTTLLSLKEDNYSKKKKMEEEAYANAPKEVHRGYMKNGKVTSYDDDVPF
ncbi:MAG: hypothetical protein EBR82_11935 [Caulobacteraceae bacterium]|nr:hypothetical protein [Caulobacteraceae bacterium]